MNPAHFAGFFYFAKSMTESKRKFLNLVKWFFIIYLLCGVILYFIQDFLLFHPVPLAKDYQFSFSQPFVELNIPTSDNRNLHVVKFTVDSSKGIILYFHGNRQNVERYANYAQLFTKPGYEVWMMDYPGFGKTTGTRTEQNLYSDAMLLYNMARNQIPADKIIMYGKSIGTGIASYVAANNPCQQLILETPYYSINALAMHYFPIYPVALLTRYSLPNYKHIQNVQAPVTIFHGTNDEIIPYQHAVRLKNMLPNLQLVTVQGGKHNNLIDHDHFTNNLDQLLKN
jgi:alpha-beta hydrolase superfamily lysophospholipase